MVSAVDPVSLAFYAGRRVVVTGHTGFKGSWLALWLSELGAEVYGFGLPPDEGHGFSNQLSAAGRLNDIRGDIRDYDALNGFIRSVQPSVVFHLAAQPLLRRSYTNPSETIATNVLGSTHVLESIRNAECVNALICVTSDKCYLNKEWQWGYRENDELGGKDPYSASKACAEHVFDAYWHSFFVHRENFGAVTVRAGNVIGGADRSKDRIVPDTIRAIEAGDPVILRNPFSTRPWQHVLDPLYGYLLLGPALVNDSKQFSGAWNFGPDDVDIRTVDDLAQRIIQAYGAGKVVHQIDADAPKEANLLHLSSEKAHRHLGWKPRWHFERAATETAVWFKAVTDGADVLEVARRQLDAFVSEGRH